MWNRTKDGYIGVTRQKPEDRFNQHRQGDDDLAQNIDKHGLDSGDMYILDEGLSGAEARERERKLRPKANMGWNTKSGGGGIADNKPGYYVYHIRPPGLAERIVKWLFRRK